MSKNTLVYAQSLKGNILENLAITKGFLVAHSYWLGAYDAHYKKRPSSDWDWEFVINSSSPHNIAYAEGFKKYSRS